MKNANHLCCPSDKYSLKNSFNKIKENGKTNKIYNQLVCKKKGEAIATPA